MIVEFILLLRSGERLYIALRCLQTTSEIRVFVNKYTIHLVKMHVAMSN